MNEETTHCWILHIISHSKGDNGYWMNYNLFCLCPLGESELLEGKIRSHSYFWISGIPLLQAGQRATSWDQLVFILFILEPFEEGSCKLFLTELMDSPLSFRSLGWVKSSWIGQSSEQSFLECFCPGVSLVPLSLIPPCICRAATLTLSSHETWVSLSPVQIPLCNLW